VLHKNRGTGGKGDGRPTNDRRGGKQGQQNGAASDHRKAPTFSDKIRQMWGNLFVKEMLGTRL
jgi:hypothetical protein